MSGIRIRQGRLDDAGLLAEFGARAFYDAFAAENTEEDMAAFLESAYTPARLQAELKDTDSLFFIAELDGETAGYAKLRFDRSEDGIDAENPAELERIYAGDPFIGKGIGSALMQRCIEEARARGHDVLWLGVWEKNGRGIAFYERWGFEKVGTHVFVVGSDPQTDHVMALRLK